MFALDVEGGKKGKRASFAKTPNFIKSPTNLSSRCDSSHHSVDMKQD